MTGLAHATSGDVQAVAAPRPLTAAEIDQVAGGIIPIIVGAAATLIVAFAYNEVANSDESDEEEQED